MDRQTMLGSIWHGFEILMMAFHGFIWTRFVIRRIWKALTVNTEVDIRPSKVNVYVDNKSIPKDFNDVAGINDVSHGTKPINTNSLTSLFKEAYGDKIMDLVPLVHKDAFLVRNKDGTEEEIGMADMALAVQKPARNVIIRNLFGK